MNGNDQRTQIVVQTYMHIIPSHLKKIHEASFNNGFTHSPSNLINLNKQVHSHVILKYASETFNSTNITL